MWHARIIVKNKHPIGVFIQLYKLQFMIFCIIINCKQCCTCCQTDVTIINFINNKYKIISTHDASGGFVIRVCILFTLSCILSRFFGYYVFYY